MGKITDLKVWQRSMELTVRVYEVTKSGDLAKDFGLKDQIRRSAVSIPSNIAEGDELKSQKQSINHFYIAKGSSAELFTQIIIAERVGYISKEISEKLKDECQIISSQLQKLIDYRSKDI